MLLYIKQKYFDEIMAGTKTYEIRAGARYRNVAAGDLLSLNGRAVIAVARVERFERMDELPEDVTDCYAADHPGPFFVFHIKSGSARLNAADYSSANRRRAVARGTSRRDATP
jgi:hypothetical protein